ncbi:MAG: amidase [Acidimicrobiales bacterium]
MNDPTQVWQHDAVGQAELVRSGEIAPDEAVRVALQRAEAVDARINSLVHRRFDEALDQARDEARDDVVRSSPPGHGDDRPFAGVPFAVKDWKCTTEGEPSTWGMASLVAIDRRATVTTELARRYEAAGLISIGRTNLPELAFGPPTTEPDAHGPCANPWAPDHSVGGSSGGSAAAVAAGIVAAANASDGGGSLRIPAACCGLVGLKVSRGRITNAPHADGRGTKVEGHLARTVRDVAALLDATAGAVPGDPYGPALPTVSWTDAVARPPGPLRIGRLDRAPRSMHPDGDPGERNRTAVDTATRLLEGFGHRVEQDHPAGLDERLQTPQLYAAERAALRVTIEEALGRPLVADDVEPRTWALFQLAASSTGSAVIAEMEAEQRWARSVAQWWRGDATDAGFDILLTPALGRDVPVLGELKETAADPLGTVGAGFAMAWFTYPFNVSGHPAIVVPVLAAEDGAVPPTAVQLVAAHGREDLLLALAAQFEEALSWPRRWPALAGGS